MKPNKALRLLSLLAFTALPVVMLAAAPTDGNPATVILDEIQAIFSSKVIILIGLFIAIYGGWNFYKTKQKEELIYAAIGGTIAVTAESLVETLKGFGEELFK